MISDEELTELAYQISNEYEELNTEYLDIVGKHIKQIIGMTAGTISAVKLQQIIKVSANSNKIRKKLVLLTGKSSAELDKIYSAILEDTEKTYFTWANKKGIIDSRTRIQANKAMRNYVEALSRTTQDTLNNLSKTTIIEQPYREIVNRSVVVVSSGATDVGSVIRGNLRQLGNGLTVQYKSGYTRRLDSAMRMNILDGCRNVNQNLRNIAGERYGADGYEISAHALCAPDHLDIQGIQVTKAEFDDLNNSLARPVGEMNCQHIAYPIILGISEPAYEEDELQEMKNLSEEEVTIGNSTRTRYEWSQECRRLETEMRKTKTTHILAGSADDKILVDECNRRLDRQQTRYRTVCSNARLAKHYDRAFVPNYSGRQAIPPKLDISDLIKR